MAKTRITITGQQFSERWQAGMQGAVGKIQQGVNNVQESPTEKAAAAQDRYLAGVQRAVNEGKFAAGCRRVSLADWKNITNQKVASNLGAGVTAAGPKVATVGAQLIDHINNGLATVNAMPKTNIQQSLQKVAAWMTHMSNFRRSS